MLLVTGKDRLIGSNGVAVSDGGRPAAAGEGPVRRLRGARA
jgi:hypothetical protein